ncbi:hypothetical protein EON80_14140, partial [bacterium]
MPLSPRQALSKMVAIHGLTLVLALLSSGALPALAQDTPATPQVATPPAEPDAEEVVEDEDAPVVPIKPFPALIALDKRDQVWTLKVSGSRVKVNGDVVVDSPNRGALWMANGSLETTNGTV